MLLLTADYQKITEIQCLKIPQDNCPLVDNKGISLARVVSVASALWEQQVLVLMPPNYT